MSENEQKIEYVAMCHADTDPSTMCGVITRKAPGSRPQPEEPT
jgi:hypothetical protein